jgi:hypothetical protein
LEGITITIDAFRALPQYFIQQAQELCDAFLLDLRPAVDLNAIYNSLVDRRPGQSFVSNPSNQLRHLYLQLANQAAGRSAFRSAWLLDLKHIL